jgi:uncharacterized membrane protein
MMRIIDHGWGMEVAWIVGIILLTVSIFLLVRALKKTVRQFQFKNRSFPTKRRERYFLNQTARVEYEEERELLKS